MSKEIDIEVPDEAVGTPYVYIERLSDGKLWNQSGLTSGAFEAELAANWATYVYPVTRLSLSSLRWQADFPLLPAGVYRIGVRFRVGAASPMDPAFPGRVIQWSGMSEVFGGFPTSPTNPEVIDIEYGGAYTPYVFVARLSDGKLWNRTDLTTAAFEVETPANWHTYVYPLTRIGAAPPASPTSLRWTAAFPQFASDGGYVAHLREAPIAPASFTAGAANPLDAPLLGIEYNWTAAGSGGNGGGSTPVVGTTIEATRATTLLVTLTGVSDLLLRQKLWFTVKIDPTSQPDSEALLQVVEGTGLTYANGAVAADATQGTLSVTGTSVNITVQAATMAVLLPFGGYKYDVKVMDSAGHVVVVAAGVFSLSATPTDAVA